MTLPASGPISQSQIAGEFGMSGASRFPTDFYGKGGAPSSGALKYSDFYGRTGTPAIQASKTFVSVNGYGATDSSTITCAAGKTIASITLVSGSASGRISQGATGGNSTTGSITSPASGTAVVDATYRYTTNTGETIDVNYHGEWGT